MPVPPGNIRGRRRWPALLRQPTGHTGWARGLRLPYAIQSNRVRTLVDVKRHQQRHSGRTADHLHQLLMPPNDGRCHAAGGNMHLSRTCTRHENPARLRVHRRPAAGATQFSWPQAATARPMADDRASAGPVAGRLGRHGTGRVDRLPGRLTSSHDSPVATPGRAPLPAVHGAARCLAMPRPAHLMAPLTRLALGLLSAGTNPAPARGGSPIESITSVNR